MIFHDRTEMKRHPAHGVDGKALRILSAQLLASDTATNEALVVKVKVLAHHRWHVSQPFRVSSIFEEERIDCSYLQFDDVASEFGI